MLYWEIGGVLAKRQKIEGWGTAVLPKLATDLHDDLPEVKGFSARNLRLMIQFFDEYPAFGPIWQRAVAKLSDDPTGGKKGPPPMSQLPAESDAAQIWQRAVAQLTWAHNVILIQKVKDLPTRLWFARQAFEHGWSRDVLSLQIQSRAHERHGNAVTNFQRTLPPPQSDLASQLLKDPYFFDFLTLEKPFHERELETGLLRHLQHFLVELGIGFAFVGRQVHMEVGDSDFYIDLLFYHLKLRCFVVIDLKVGPFKAEYAGKMNFYLNAVDDRLKHATDQRSIGLILCEEKKQNRRRVCPARHGQSHRRFRLPAHPRPAEETPERSAEYHTVGKRTVADHARQSNEAQGMNELGQHQLPKGWAWASDVQRIADQGLQIFTFSTSDRDTSS